MNQAFSSVGIGRMWRRRGLVLLIYLLGLAIAMLIGSAVFRMLFFEIGPTGFSDRLVKQFDLVLWFDYWDGIGAGLAAVARQAVVAGLLIMFWKVASSVGLIHAFQGDGTSSFWEGVSRFTLRGFGLGVLFLLPMLILNGVIIGGGLAMARSMGQVGAFWSRFVALPLIVVILAAVFDLFHDYARMQLVLRGATIRRSWLEGIKWPFLHFRSVILYKIWFLGSAILWAAVLAVGFYMPDQTVGAVLLAFLVQQILLYGRAAAYVAWTGAEVSFFETFAPPIPEPEAVVESPTTEIAGNDARFGMA